MSDQPEKIMSSAEMLAFADSLRQFQPIPLRIDRDNLLFQAGIRYAQSNSTWYWRMIAGISICLTLVVGSIYLSQSLNSDQQIASRSSNRNRPANQSNHSTSTDPGNSNSISDSMLPPFRSEKASDQNPTTMGDEAPSLAEDTFLSQLRIRQELLKDGLANFNTIPHLPNGPKWTGTAGTASDQNPVFLSPNRSLLPGNHPEWNSLEGNPLEWNPLKGNSLEGDPFPDSTSLLLSPKWQNNPAITSTPKMNKAKLPNKK